MTYQTRTIAKKPMYEWNEVSGVIKRDKNGVTRQAIQLLLGNGGYPFRRKCGKLLVEALNKETKCAT